MQILLSRFRSDTALYELLMQDRITKQILAEQALEERLGGIPGRVQSPYFRIPYIWMNNRLTLNI